MSKLEQKQLSKGVFMNWYLLQTKPNSQALARKHLRQQGFEIFLPRTFKTSKRGVRFVEELKPLFPSYLFLGAKKSDIPWRSINATRGVSKTVTLDGCYRPIALEIIESIRRRCDQNDILQSMDHIKIGDRVKIERGPLANFICNVDKIADNERVWVLIDILQQQTRTEVSLVDLFKIH